MDKNSGDVNISDISGGETHVGPIVTGYVEGDVVDGDKVGGDKVGRDKITIGQQIINFFTGDSEQQRELRNRQAMLTLVHNTWVKGVLEKSLHGAVLIELDLEERKDAIEHPLEMELRRAGQANRRLLADVKMATVFDEVGRNLLILGDPGSGKTTMLLELVRETISRARADNSQPIPVVLNLSSWNDPRQSIADWLMLELNTKYNIPKKIAQSWVDTDALLLLLDGLDEVAERVREECVSAINAFHQTHFVPLVVCSRSGDYERLSTRLRLESAIFIKPLTPEKIDQFLSNDRLKLEAVTATLQRDKPLQELVQTPLMLSIMALAYQGLSKEDLHQFNTVETRREHLFDTYIKRMFERRGVVSADLRKQTIKWLGWLAQRMVKTSQTEYLIERMQPGWLETARQKRIYGSMVGFLSGFIGGLFVGFSFGLFDRLLLLGLAFGLFLGLVFGLLVGLSGLIFGLAIDWSDDIKPFEVLNWSWHEIKWVMNVGLISGLLGGLIFGLIGGLSGRLFDGVLFGLLPGLGVGLISGLISGPKTLETRVFANQGIWQSGKNAVVRGLLGGLILGLPVGIMYGPFLGLFFGLSGGLAAGIFGGGLPFIQHFSLRFVLWRTGQLPWRLVPFLDHTADLIFLRKVGGGYIFIHRLLMEHFASLEPED